MARQRQAIINGLRDSIKNFANDVEDVNSKDVIEMMMITQYFDMLRDVGARWEILAVPLLLILSLSVVHTLSYLAGSRFAAAGIFKTLQLHLRDCKDVYEDNTLQARQATASA